MKLWHLFKFETPSVFGKYNPKAAPPEKTLETRFVSDALDHPHLSLFAPDALHFPDHTLPTVPGQGGYVTCGLNMVSYDHQATWDRSRTDQAGPVREFFRGVMWDNRIKHM